MLTRRVQISVERGVEAAHSHSADDAGGRREVTLKQGRECDLAAARVALVAGMSLPLSRRSSDPGPCVERASGPDTSVSLGLISSHLGSLPTESP